MLRLCYVGSIDIQYGERKIWVQNITNKTVGIEQLRCTYILDFYIDNYRHIL